MVSNDKKQTSKNHSFIQSLRHALEGLQTTVHDEENFKRHLIVAAIVLLCGGLFRVKQAEWLWLLVVIFLVLIAEMWNTAVEYLIDLLVEKHYDPLAKKVKDVSAAIVLITAILAAIVGAIIFLPYILNWLHLWR